MPVAAIVPVLWRCAEYIVPVAAILPVLLAGADDTGILERPLRLLCCCAVMLLCCYVPGGVGVVSDARSATQGDTRTARAQHFYHHRVNLQCSCGSLFFYGGICVETLDSFTRPTALAAVNGSHNLDRHVLPGTR